MAAPRRWCAVEVHQPDDARLSAYRQLTDQRFRRSYEKAANVFVVEGRLAIAQLLRSGWPVVSLLVSRDRRSSLEFLLGGPEEPGGPLGGPTVPVYLASVDVLASIAGYPVHRGYLALGRRRSDIEAAALLQSSTSLLIVEAVTDTENLGGLFRNAAAFGVDAVLLDPHCGDPLTRRAVRVSMGHALLVPFSRASPWPAALESVRSAGFQLVALTPRADAVSIDSVELDTSVPRAVMVGAEGSGLSDGALAWSDLRVRIPMAPGVDSLNVATAAAVALHSLVRARRT
jgi:tRNA G18 (ribose-2'-O)-methylase SpoU